MKGEFESSKTLSHFRVHTVLSAILAQYSSGFASDSLCSALYLSPAGSRPAVGKEVGSYHQLNWEFLHP